MKENKVSVIGAGLVGSLLACLLQKEGYNVSLFERNPDPRSRTNYGGRSINLALSHRGLKALRRLAIEDEIMELALPMRGRMIHAIEGQVDFQPYSSNPNECIYSISRAELNKRLIAIAEENNVPIQWEHQCNWVDFDNKSITFKTKEGEKTHQAEVLLGADGIYSGVRKSFQFSDRFNYDQLYLEHAYKELTIPADKEGKHQMAADALHIWPRGQFMLIALPNLDGSFTLTLFLPYEGEVSFEALNTPQKVITFFATTFPDALPLIPDLVEDFFQNPTSSLATIACYPWVKNETIALIGDAAHGIVPFYGQGMNAGFEDCFELIQLLTEGKDWSTVLDQYQQQRKVNADAIRELALDNFIEMRDLVDNPDFLLAKKIEHHLHQTFGDRWIPKYEMVTFSNLSYAEAFERSIVQEELIHHFIESEPEVEQQLTSPDFQEKLKALIEVYENSFL